MKVIVLGGGVIGVSCAYFLARAGHEVVLLERREGWRWKRVSPMRVKSRPAIRPLGVARPAGQGAQMDVDATSPPGAVASARPGPLVVDGQLLGNCNAEAYGRNKGRMLALAEYSRDCLRALRDETGIAYDERTRGTCSYSVPPDRWMTPSPIWPCWINSACPMRCSTGTAASPGSPHWPGYARRWRGFVVAR
jgi:D-amino-acid dehydrogenase